MVDIALPAAFARKVEQSWGEPGRRWLARLPELVARLLRVQHGQGDTRGRREFPRRACLSPTNNGAALLTRALLSMRLLFLRKSRLL